MNNYCVYLLIDPRNKLPFYVGKGLKKRPKQHLNSYLLDRGYNQDKKSIIKSILNDKLKPEIKIISENLCEMDAFDIECEQIKHYGRKEFGGILSNMSDGGEGQSGHRLTAETKKKISMSMMGEKNHFYGKKHSSDTLKKIGDVNRGKILNSNWKNKISLALKGKRKTLEHRKRISLSLKGKLKNRLLP